MKAGNISYYDIDAYVEAQMHRLKIPGVSLAVIENDRIVHLRGFGKVNPSGDVPNPQTPFFIGSLTKSFTALAVMQLVESGKIDLDMPVQHYLSWFRVADLAASSQMTVRHLLNQTSSLPTSVGEIPLADFDNSRDACERQARALAKLTLTRPIGSRFEYSNANYNLLGLIIEAVSGEPYAGYVQNHIFGPLGMSHSYTSPELAKKNGMAVGHQYWFTYPIAVPDIPVPHGSLAGGFLISSVEDMGRYLIAFLNDGRYGDVQTLSEEGIKMLHRGAVNVDYLGIPLGKYGMGWYDGKIGRTKLLWHSGVLPHFFAFMGLLPEQKKGFVFLCNADHHWMSPVLTGIGTGLAERLAGEGPQPASVPFVDMIPWILRGLLLVPVLQAAGVIATLRQLRFWRQVPDRRPHGNRVWTRHILVPLVPQLLAVLALRPMLGKKRGYQSLYMPDCFWTTMIFGSFGLVWSFVRTGLILKALKNISPSRPNKVPGSW